MGVAESQVADGCRCNGEDLRPPCQLGAPEIEVALGHHQIRYQILNLVETLIAMRNPLRLFIQFSKD
jgi:hypothetical protein